MSCSLRARGNTRRNRSVWKRVNAAPIRRSSSCRASTAAQMRSSRCVKRVIDCCMALCGDCVWGGWNRITHVRTAVLGGTVMAIATITEIDYMVRVSRHLVISSKTYHLGDVITEQLRLKLYPMAMKRLSTNCQTGRTTKYAIQVNLRFSLPF